MDAPKEFNTELKAEVNKTFADLYKEIGNNRQQLTNKVLNAHKEITKELNRETVSDDRRKQILAEVSRTIRMAAQQLPHLTLRAPKADGPVPAPKVVPAPKPVAAPKPPAPPKPVAAPKAVEKPAPKPAPKKEAHKPAPKAKATPAKAKPELKKSAKNIPAKKKK